MDCIWVTFHHHHHGRFFHSTGILLPWQPVPFSSPSISGHQQNCFTHRIRSGACLSPGVCLRLNSNYNSCLYFIDSSKAHFLHRLFNNLFMVAKLPFLISTEISPWNLSFIHLPAWGVMKYQTRYLVEQEQTGCVWFHTRLTHKWGYLFVM